MSSYTPVEVAFKVFHPSEKKNKPDILLLHGITQSKETWDGIAQQLADGTYRKVYALDFRNHGDSDWIDGFFDFEDIVKDVKKFMDKQDMKRVLLIGQSMGGKISMIIALEQPERVEKVVVEEYSPIPLKGERETTCRYITLLERSIQSIPAHVDLITAQKMIVEFLDNVLSKQPTKSSSSTRSNPYFAMPIVKKEAKYIWKTNFEVIKKMCNVDSIHKVLKGLYQEPVLFLYGTHSQYNIPQYKDEILKIFPKAQLQGIKDASHVCHLDNPQDVVEKILKYVNEE